MESLNGCRRVGRPGGDRWRGPALLLLVSLFVFGSSRAPAQVAATPDVAIRLGSPAQVVGQEDVAIQDLLGGVTLEPLGSGIPDAVALTGFGHGVANRRLLSFDRPVDLGPFIAGKGDVVSFDGVEYRLEFEGAAQGVPRQVGIDAVALALPSALLLSFDTDCNLSGLWVADEDLVRWDGVGFEKVFDGSAEGLPRSLDVDAAQDLGGGALLMSMDAGGAIGGIVFEDDDVLRFDGTTWILEFDASATDANWRPADLQTVMVPEASHGALFVSGLVALALMSGSRRRIRPMAIASGVALGLVAGETPAADGQWEINQTCAVQTGCFPGDSPGFPVTINTPGSYRLTSNLVVPASTAGIFPSSGDFSLDLGGFEMAGPVVCTGTGSGVSCDSDVGSGIAAGDDDHVQVFNGFVRGFGFNGIAVGDHSQVHHVVVERNSHRGVSAGDHAIVHDVVSWANEATGILVGDDSVVQHSVSNDNRVDGFSAGDNSTVAGSVAWRNGDDGIDVVDGAVVRGNRSAFNELTGVEAGGGCLIVDNLSTHNGTVSAPAAGVRAGQGTSVSGNVLIANQAAGINFVGPNGSYRGNNLSSNAGGAVTGVALDLGGNVP